MKSILTAIFAFFSSLNPVFTAVSTGLVCLITAFQWLNDEWAVMVARIDTLAHASFAGTLDISPCALIDTFLPLHEGLTFFSAFLGVLGVATGIRIVKSFIPTLAS